MEFTGMKANTTSFENSPLELSSAISVLAVDNAQTDGTISVNYNGQCFHISMSTRFVQASPYATDLYLKILKAIHPNGPGLYGGIHDKDVFAWVTGLFLPTFQRLAAESLTVFGQDESSGDEAVSTPSECLPSKIFECRLEAVDEMFLPRYIGAKDLGH